MVQAVKNGKDISGVPRNFFSTNSVEDRAEKRRSGGDNPLIRGSAQFSNE
jgi:hypothetical protein